MKFLQRIDPSPETLTRVAHNVLLVFLAFAIFWRGGKLLDTTWLLMAIAWLFTYQFWRLHPRPKLNLPWWLWGSALLFVLWTVASYANTTAGNYGLDEVFRTGALVFMFLWMARSSKEPFDAQENGMGFGEKVLRVIASSVMLATIIGYCVYILQPVSRFVGTFFDLRFHTDYWPNAWGEFLLLTWPVVLWWIVKINKETKPDRQKDSGFAYWVLTFSSWKFLPMVVLGFLFSGLMLSYSRGTSMAFIGQLIVWVAILWRQGKVQTPWPMVRKAAIIFAIALGFALFANGLRSQLYDVESVVRKATFSSAEGFSSVSERHQFWGVATNLALQRPLFGWGPYTFRFLQPRTQEHVLATSDHAHNVFLKLAMERGIPAAILFAFIVGAVLFWHGRRLFMIDGSIVSYENPLMNGIAPNLFIAILGVLAHNLIDYNLQFIGIVLPFWMILGMLASSMLRKDAWLPAKGVRVVEVLLITSLMLVAVVEGRFLILSSFGRHAESRENTTKALHWYDLSKGQRFTRDLHLSRAYLLLKQEKPEDAMLALDDYFAVNGEDGRAYKLRGDACRQQRDLKCAIENYERAYALIKYNDAGTMRALIETLLASGKRAEVDDRRAEFDSLMNTYAEAVERNAHFIALSSNAEEIVLLSNLFRKLYPKDEPRYVVLGAGVSRKMAEEHERVQSRPPGYLW